MPAPETANGEKRPRFSAAERAQLRQMLLYLAGIVAFMLLALLILGLLLNFSS